MSHHVTANIVACQVYWQATVIGLTGGCLRYERRKSFLKWYSRTQWTALWNLQNTQKRWQKAAFLHTKIHRYIQDTWKDTSCIYVIIIDIERNMYLCTFFLKKNIFFKLYNRLLRRLNYTRRGMRAFVRVYQVTYKRLSCIKHAFVGDKRSKVLELLVNLAVMYPNINGYET